MFEDKL